MVAALAEENLVGKGMELEIGLELRLRRKWVLGGVWKIGLGAYIW